MALYRQLELRKIAEGYIPGDNSMKLTHTKRVVSVDNHPEIQTSKVIRLKGEESYWYIEWMGMPRKRLPWKWNVGGIETLQWG